MGRTHCAENDCRCDLGRWFELIDWELLNQQIETLVKIRDKAQRNGEGGAYGELPKVDHLSGLCDVLASLQNLRSEPPADNVVSKAKGDLAGAILLLMRLT